MFSNISILNTTKDPRKRERNKLLWSLVKTEIFQFYFTKNTGQEKVQNDDSNANAGGGNNSDDASDGNEIYVS